MTQTISSLVRSEEQISSTPAKLPSLSEEIIQHDDYQIAVTQSQSFPFENHPVKFNLSNTVGWLCWVIYLIIETRYIESLGSGASFNRICLWAGLLAELALHFIDASWAMDAMISISKPQKQGRRPHYKLVGSNMPHVDVFVTTCGEPVEVIMNTVRAAAALNYSTTKLNVMVLDDGHDENLRWAIDSFNKTQTGFAAVHYRSRETNAFFKAGNLNFGITETKKLTGGQFMASLDADMIVSPDWLRNMVPHLLLDSKIGLVTSPQNYYNVPYGDPLAQQTEFSIWNTIFEPLHDYDGEAMCMGTGFVVRRTALESIGGWPLTATGEDYMCSTKLVGKGWKIGFVRENHQHGITPESFQGRIKQRLRWIDAAFEVHTANNWYLTNDFGEGVTLLDKAASLIFALRDLSAITTLLSLIVLPIFILVSASAEPLPSQPNTAYSMLNVALLTAFLVTKLCEWDIYHHIGMSHLSNLQALDVWAAPYCALRCFSHLLPPLRTSPTFFITGTFACPTDERNSARRAPLLHRLTTFGILFHLVYTVTGTLILMYTLSLSHTSIPPSQILTLAKSIYKTSIPVIYMLFPPTMPEWKGFLAADHKGVLRPKKPFPQYIRPDQAGGLEMGWARTWRDAIEVVVLAALVGR